MRVPIDDWQNKRAWWDAIRCPLIIAAMAVVVVGDVLLLAEAAPPDIVATMTGVAAVISALAMVIEARRGGAVQGQLADHEARLRVLEDRGNRS